VIARRGHIWLSANSPAKERSEVVTLLVFILPKDY
jgi:hypothetical protein